MKDIIVGLGEILWDIFPQKKILGGAPANFAFSVSQLGYDGYVVSAVGDDMLGNNIIETLAQKNLKHLLEVTADPTGTVYVDLSKDGIPQYKITEHVAWDNIPFTNQMLDLAKTARAICFGTLAQRSRISQESINKFIAEANDDCTIICDINLRQHYYSKELVEHSISIADIVKLNEDELKIISAMYNLEHLKEDAICQWLLEYHNLEVLILTKGADGSYILTSEELSYIPTPNVEVVDTVGAGDAFTASFIASYLKRVPIRVAHQLAVDISAYTCTQEGAMSPIPKEYIERLNNR